MAPDARTVKGASKAVKTGAARPAVKKTARAVGGEGGKSFGKQDDNTLRALSRAASENTAMDRREFLVFMGRAALAIGAIAVGASFLRFFRFFSSPGKSIDEGTGLAMDPDGFLVLNGDYLRKDDVPASGLKFLCKKDGSSFPAIVMTLDGNIHATSIKCTHEGCTVMREGDMWYCPCHAATFEVGTGKVTSGPARDPLASLAVTEESDGRLRIA